MVDIQIILVAAISFLLAVYIAVYLFKRHKILKAIKDEKYFNHLKEASKNHG